jgi:integrase
VTTSTPTFGASVQTRETNVIRKINGPNPYEVRLWANGRQCRRRFRTKKEATSFELEVRAREARRRSGLPEERRPITLSALVDRFLDQYDVQSKKWKREMLDYSVAKFGGVRVRDLSSERIALWIATLPHGPKTVKHILDSLRQVLNQGVEWGYMPANPARPAAVRGPRQTAPDIRPFRSWAEVEQVARAAGSYGALIRFACATGLRPEEWAALTWADVDFAARTVTVNKVWVKGKLRLSVGKSEAAFRTVSLQEPALAALRSLPRPLQSEHPVFTAPNGGYIDLDNWRARVWKKAMTASGLEYRPLYQMRHTFATLALAASADIYWVSKQLGHESIRTTLKHYARFVPAVDERNMRLLDDFAARAAEDVSEACQASEADRPF